MDSNSVSVTQSVQLENLKGLAEGGSGNKKRQLEKEFEIVKTLG